MQNAKLVAWGLIVSFAVVTLATMGVLAEAFLSLGGLGMWVFGVWAIVLLFKNAK